MVRRSRPKNRRDLILRAAAELFRDRGYPAVGIDDIGEAVGITGPAVYRHFRSKEDVLLAALERILDHTLERLDATVGDATGVEAVVRTMQGLVSTTMQEWDFAVVFRREAQPLPESLRAQLRAKRRRVIEYLTRATHEVHPTLTGLDLRLLLEIQYGALAGVLAHGNPAQRRRYEPIVSRMTADILLIEEVPPLRPREPALLPSARASRASRRETVLAAAVELFADSSYPTVGIDEAGTNAGITGPSVYRHFANKEALLVEALRRMGDHLNVLLSSTLALQAPPESVLAEMTRRLVEVAYASPDLFVVYFNEGHHATGAALAWYEQQVSTLFDEWAGVLRRSWRGLGEVEARTIAYGVVGAVARVASTRSLRQSDWRDLLGTTLRSIQTADGAVPDRSGP